MNANLGGSVLAGFAARPFLGAVGLPSLLSPTSTILASDSSRCPSLPHPSMPRSACRPTAELPHSIRPYIKADLAVVRVDGFC